MNELNDLIAKARELSAASKKAIEAHEAAKCEADRLLWKRKEAGEAFQLIMSRISAEIRNGAGDSCP